MIALAVLSAHASLMISALVVGDAMEDHEHLGLAATLGLAAAAAFAAVGLVRDRRRRADGAATSSTGGGPPRRRDIRLTRHGLRLEDGCRLRAGEHPLSRDEARSAAKSLRVLLMAHRRPVRDITADGAHVQLALDLLQIEPRMHRTTAALCSDGLTTVLVFHHHR